MNARVVLALAVAFFLLGLCALGGAGFVLFAKRSPPPAATAPPGTAPAAPTPAPPRVTVETSPPTAPTIVVHAPSPEPEKAPEPAPPPPPPAPVAGPRPMRPELGLSLSDSNILNGPIELGPSSIGVGERAPKVAGLVGGSPASQGGIRPGDHVFSVDGRPVETVAEFEAALAKKTIPGEVLLKVGPTHYDAHDVRIVFK